MSKSPPPVVGSPPLRSAMKHPLTLPNPSPPLIHESPASPLADNGDDRPSIFSAVSNDSSSSSLLNPNSNPMKRSTSNTNNSSGTSTPTYQRRVGFDTFDSGMALENPTGGGTGVTYAFSISAKSANYCRAKESRTFLVCTDLNEYSTNALDWALENSAEDGDEVVILRVVEVGSKEHAAWQATMEESREEATKVLEDVMRANAEEKQISVVVEFTIGEVEETIHRMVEIYKPDSLIVGTRGRTEKLWKTAFMGSISRYCLANSPVPTVVVRPTDKVRKSLSARQADPKRRSYVSLMMLDDKSTHELGRSRTIDERDQGRRSLDGASRSRDRSGVGGKENQRKAKDEGREMKRATSRELYGIS